MITKYNNYLKRNKVLEGLRNFPLFLSDRLMDILKKMDHEAAKELLSMHNDLDTRVTKTFVDIHEQKNNYFTFTQPNKAVRILNLDDITEDEQIKDRKDDIINNINNNDDLYQKYRSEIRIGSFISEIFGDKYPESLSGGQNKKDRESFVNLYKAYYSEEEKFIMFDVVHGDRISHFYNCNNYDLTNDDSSLSNSCMRRVPSYYFDIYTKNSNVGLVIMYSDNTHTKIKGRAILWKLDSHPGRYFMDRVYTDDYSDEQLFINYAKSKNWMYKKSQSMGSDIKIVDPENGNDGSYIDLWLELNNLNYNSFPYCDTMVYFNPDNNIISNTDNHNPKFELISTGGDYERIGGYDDDDYDNYVYSQYNGEDINRDEATYCELGQDWVYTREAIRVFNTGLGTVYATPDYEGIVEQTITVNGETKTKHFLKDRCIWSDYLNTWIFKPSSVKVWLNKEKTSQGIEHKKRKDIDFIEVDGELYAKNLFE